MSTPEEDRDLVKAHMQSMTFGERMAFRLRVLPAFLRGSAKPLAQDLAHNVNHRAMFSGRDLCHWCKAPIKLGATTCRKCGRDQEEYTPHLARRT